MLARELVLLVSLPELFELAKAGDVQLGVMQSRLLEAMDADALAADLASLAMAEPDEDLEDPFEGVDPVPLSAEEFDALYHRAVSLRDLVSRIRCLIEACRFSPGGGAS